MLLGVYAVVHKNEEVRAASRSGGIFTAVSDYVIDKGGIVYGCILDESMTAKHIRADNRVDRDKMRGSKYLQSHLGKIFVEIKRDLENGRLVLFTGTSCQVAGLKSFLGKEYNNLVCMDIICHGVPSERVWKEYLSWMEKKNKSKIVHVDFRNKAEFGWASHTETLYFENGKSVNSNIYRKVFYKHCILRPACYECKYKSIYHHSDITIGDYWGIEKAAPQLDDNKGVSLVLLNSNRGMDIFNNIKDDINYVATKIEDSLQPPLVGPYEAPEDRDDFWNDFFNKNFSFIAKKYGEAGIREMLREKKRLIKKHINR